jgi:hypothetical protein
MSNKKIGDYLSYSPLTKLLQAAYAGNSERKRILESNSAKTLLVPEIGEDNYKALLQSNALQESNLLQEEVFKTISEGAEPFKCMREVLPIIKTDSYSVRVVKGEVGSYAEEVAEGAKVPIDTQVYSKEDISISKIGTRPIITNELIEDSLFDIAELELRKAGARMENKLNRDCILEVLTDVGVTDVDPGGSHIAVTDLAKARADVEAQNYMPDTLITHPSAEGYLLQDSNLVYASYAGTAETLRNGKIPTILGMTPRTLSVTTGSTSKYWDGTDGANHYNAVLLDSKASTYLAMRRDLTVEEYDDPIHDILGIACTMRYGVGTVQPNAGVAILSK